MMAGIIISIQQNEGILSRGTRWGFGRPREGRSFTPTRSSLSLRNSTDNFCSDLIH
jgi:hypothetical protein